MDILFVRPWYYIEILEWSIMTTDATAKKALEGPYSDALGSGLDYYYCWHLFNNQKLLF